MPSSTLGRAARIGLAIVALCLASCAVADQRPGAPSAFEKRYLLELMRGRAPTPQEAERAPVARLRLTVPSGFASERVDPGRAWGLTEDLERLQGDRDRTTEFKDVVFEVAASGYVAYDRTTDKFNEGPAAVRDAMKARGWTDVKIERHDVDGVPIESVAWTADGRRHRVLYIAIAPQVRESGLVVRVLMHDKVGDPARGEAVWSRLITGLRSGTSER